MVEEYDLVIVGGGPAGYSAAVYAARFNLKTLVIARLRGGLITTTHLVENYPGYTSISGPELGEKFEECVRANNVPIEDGLVTSIEKNDKKYVVKTDGGKEFLAKSLVLATGTKHKKLGAPGEKEFAGAGVSYCATCDGNFFRNKTVAVIGGGNGAAKDAMVLAQLAKKVYMVVRSYVKAEPANCKVLESLNNLEIIEGVNVKEIKGDGVVSHLVLDKEYNGSDKLDVNGVFIAIGHVPQTELAKSLGVELEKDGSIKIDKFSKTNIDSIMAAGDVANLNWKQAIVSAAQGSLAGYSAYNYIVENYK